MSFTATLTAQSLQTLDPEKMHQFIAGMGEQVLDARKRALEALATIQLPKGIRRIIIGGMGGSAIGGDLVRSYVANSCVVPVSIIRNYELPVFADEHTLFIASSYSGNTEETLSLLEEVKARRIPFISISTGGELFNRSKDAIARITLPTGFQPRAALAYGVIPVLTVLESAGLVEDQTEAINGTVQLLARLADQYGVSKMNESNPAYALAMSLLHRVPIFYSAPEPFDVLGVRWRGQMQENAKHLADSNVFPEMNHGEISGWHYPIEAVRELVPVYLRSKQDEHPRITKRFEAVREVFAKSSINVLEANAEGGSVLERIFSLITLGDWVSYYLALLEGVDPTPIPAIEDLKKRL